LPVSKSPQISASREGRIARAEADKIYMHHVDTSRLAFKNDPDTYEKLLLSSRKTKPIKY
jgi:hypothetical protein